MADEEKAVDVQEAYDIQPRVVPDSSKEELNAHIKSCHDIIIKQGTMFKGARRRYIDLLSLITRLYDWASKHPKQYVNGITKPRIEIFAQEIIHWDDWDMWEEIEKLREEKKNEKEYANNPS